VCELEAYAKGTASQDVINKVQYLLNYDQYYNQVNTEKVTVLQYVQDSIEDWKDAADDQKTSQVLNAFSVLWSTKIRNAYEAVSAGQTDTSSVTVTLTNAPCAGFDDPAECNDFVADMQQQVNDSLAALNKSKAKLGLDVPVKKDGPVLLTPGGDALTARSKSKTHARPEIVVAGTKGTVTLTPGETEKIHMPIPAFVRAEFKHDLSKGIRTLHEQLQVEISDSNGDFTTRTIPVTIHLVNMKPKKKHHRRAQRA
jgi:hypothetical protein